MSVETITDTAAKDQAALEAWVKPEIASFEPVSATQSITNNNPGDILSSNS